MSFSQDSSGVLAALGVNNFFTGSDARDIAVNETIKGSARRCSAAAKNGNTGRQPDRTGDRRPGVGQARVAQRRESEGNVPGDGERHWRSTPRTAKNNADATLPCRTRSNRSVNRSRG